MQALKKQFLIAYVFNMERYTEHKADFKNQITGEAIEYYSDFIGLYIERHLKVCYSKYK